MLQIDDHYDFYNDYYLFTSVHFDKVCLSAQLFGMCMNIEFTNKFKIVSQ